MIKTFLITVVTAALFLTGCSSYPGTKEAVAKAACRAFIQADIKKMQLYMGEKALKQSQKNSAFIQKFFESDEYRQIKEASDCTKISRTEELEKVHKLYLGRFKIKLALIDDEWRIID